ncbi:hypothetical protein [Aestuariivirga sp.]|uniref:hypothetical protein n=1 Tax=Aestuariivirga sp. TaxID=2650926 RepID=UPI00391DC502
MAVPGHRIPQLSMPELLEQLARELAALQAMVAEMEGAVDDMIERQSGMLDSRSIRNLQLLDILSQTLAALSAFAGLTASLSSADWRVDAGAATAGLKLASLAQRLARGAVREEEETADAYELFGD